MVISEVDRSKTQSVVIAGIECFFIPTASGEEKWQVALWRRGRYILLSKAFEQDTARLMAQAILETDGLIAVIERDDDMGHDDRGYLLPWEV